MMVLSTYSAVPLFSVLAAMVCPRHTRLAQGLAAALGCLLGTLVGAFLAQAKKDAAASAVARLLSQHLGEDMPADELRDLISRARRRFGVPPLERSSEAWENTSLQEIYEGLLNRFVEVSEFKPDELSLLQRLKEVLELDGIVAGNAHRHAAQLLVSRGYSGLEGEPMKIATDKLLYLSQRIFAEETPQEAARYEMGRLCQVLDLPKKEAAERIRKVAVEYGEEPPTLRSRGKQWLGCGNLLAYASSATSAMTVIIGLIYMYWHFPSFNLKFDDCYFEDPDEYTYWVDCNSTWANDWGMVGIPVWVPFLIGLTGAMMVNPMVLQVVGFPRNFVQHGFFLIVQAMFANIGYCGKLGVTTGFVSIAIGVIDIVAAGFGIKSDRMKELQRLKDGIGYHSQDEESESE
ncbi:unnamed protein product [Effrenium voratum]|uniref:Uncharacterized protein n=1 Tax=Effrenium voratum TaxID=2562239 RepID=A0AA36I0J1_9DINO|nr:unnamed protein product [Effrenium voratum]